MSMNRLWSDKIKRIWKEVRLLENIYYPKVMDWAKNFANFREPNIQCENIVDFVNKTGAVGAFDQLFKVFPQTAETCWQYTIDFMRGLACSICDSSSTFYYSHKGFTLDKTECYSFAKQCSFHMHSYRTFFEYAKWFSAIASCKT